MLLEARTKLKEELYKLVLANGTLVNKESGIVCCKTKALTMALVQGHMEKIQLDVGKLRNY